MNATQPTDFNDTASLDDRDVRALRECMTVLPTDAPGLYEVTTESGSTYRVDAEGQSCMCPDARHRDARCKHIRRVAFATGQRPLPTWIDTDAVDPQLGLHVAGPVMADGGAVVVEGGEGDADDACEDCAGLRDGDLCWDCYNDIRSDSA